MTKACHTRARAAAGGRAVGVGVAWLCHSILMIAGVSNLLYYGGGGRAWRGLVLPFNPHDCRSFYSCIMVDVSWL
jgi:hypothetical protein